MNKKCVEMVSDCLKQFEVTDTQLQQIQTRILRNMEQALNGQTDPTPSVRILPTYIRSTPQGTEQGNFLVLEIGTSGADFRVLWVTLTGMTDQKEQLISQEFTIPPEILIGSGQQLFDFVAGCLVEFLDQLKVGSQVIELGFNFAFPSHQTAVDKSILISWAKNFKCTDGEGQDVVQLLRDAIRRQGAYNINVVAVVNDAVSTMMNCEPKPQASEIGFILDIGTNACYMEEAKHVKELGEDKGRICVNVQWGSFDDNEALKHVQTQFDIQLDQKSLHPGTERFEKMIGSLYLGELVRLVLIHLANEKALFCGNTTSALLTCGSVHIKHLMEIEEHGRAQAQAVLQGLGLKPTIQDCDQVKQVCEAVTIRSARLCAAALAAVIARVKNNEDRLHKSIAVATGGRIYEQHPRFSTILQQTVKFLVPDYSITFVPAKFCAGRGVAIVTAVASRLASQRRVVEQVLAPYRMSNEQLKAVQAKMREAMERGLKGEDSSVRMLPTYVRVLPDGTERGNYLALDLGGTKFRVLLVKLNDVNMGGIQMISQIFPLPKSVTQGTGQQLFDHIVDCMVRFQKENRLVGQTYSLGFTFSFPCKQLGLNQAILLKWAKDFNASDCVGQDVVTLLRDAISRRGVIKLDKVAVINDTVATMMSCGYEDPNCEVGLIVGTGTNACYMEEMSNVSTVPGDEGRMCINMEWGAFEEDDLFKDIYTHPDIIVDKCSINPGHQRFEKLMGGMYLGDIVRRILLLLARLGVLFRGQVFQCLKNKEYFKTKLLSEIESPDLKRLEAKAILERLGLSVNCEDITVVKEVCQAVSRRAAHLCGAGMAAVVEKIRENRSLDELTVTVGVDGTLYKQHPHFSNEMKETVKNLAPRCSVKFLKSEDGSGKGAALVIAVVCRLAEAAAPLAGAASHTSHAASIAPSGAPSHMTTFRAVSPTASTIPAGAVSLTSRLASIAPSAAPSHMTTFRDVSPTASTIPPGAVSLASRAASIAPSAAPSHMTTFRDVSPTASTIPPGAVSLASRAASIAPSAAPSHMTSFRAASPTASTIPPGAVSLASRAASIAPSTAPSHMTSIAPSTAPSHMTSFRAASPTASTIPPGAVSPTASTIPPGAVSLASRAASIAPSAAPSHMTSFRAASPTASTIPPGAMGPPAESETET